jgi:exopolysaccharide biosynthesis polyprenyl glycosylphosphotransferase
MSHAPATSPDEDSRRARKVPASHRRAKYPARPSRLGLPVQPAFASGKEGRRLDLLRWGARPYLMGTDALAVGASSLALGLTFPAAVLAVACASVAAAWLGLYRPRLSRSLLDDLPYVAAVAMVSSWVAAAQSMARETALVEPVVVYCGTVTAATLFARMFAYAAIRRARTSGRIRYRTIILGAGSVGTELAGHLARHPEYGVDPVGFVDTAPPAGHVTDLPCPLLGTPDELDAIIRAFRVRNVIIAFSAMREADLIPVLQTCHRLKCEILFVPRLYEVHSTTREMDIVWGIPLVRARRAAFRSPLWPTKRVLDVILSGTALVVLSPVFAACAAAVRLEGGRGVLFRQVRVGLDGRLFTVLKFRSFRPADDSDSNITWNIANDKRLGPVGRFLRRTSLDELPQLWNVLVGDMSLVGPRPERPHFVAEFSERIPRYEARHRVPVGLTGWAQVHGLRGDTSIADRIRFDNFYVENWSLWTDTKIAIRTLGQVLRASGG